MCLPFCSCFGPPRTDDLGPPNKRNGGHYYNGNGYPAHGAAAGAEADRKASNDVRRDTAHHAGAAAGPRGWHGHAATGAQEKAAYPYVGADGTLKQQAPAAWNGKVGADGHGARGGTPRNYYAQPPPHREDAADSHYTAATATAHHESPSEALGGE